MMLNIFSFVQTFIIGACVGSFLNVVIYRFPSDLSVVKPRSFCPKCKKKLTWRENIPLISWIVQKGKCLSCNKKISIRYPFVELFTGCLFVIFLSSSPSLYESSSNIFLNVIFSWIFLSLLICITTIDIDEFWIPQGLINFGFIFGLLGLIFIDILNNRFIDLNLILKTSGGSLIAFLIFESLRKFAKQIYKKDAFGKGDSKLIAMIALWLGPLGIVLCVSISYIFAALFCLAGLSLKKFKLKQAIPFAPFLSLGGLIVWFLGNDFLIEKILRI